MKAQELKQKSESELNDLLVEKQKELFQLRMQRATGQLGQPHLFKQTRREVAQIKTVITQLQAGE